MKLYLNTVKSGTAIPFIDLCSYIKKKLIPMGVYIQLNHFIFRIKNDDNIMKCNKLN